jgi:hypothetical protein
VERAATSGVAVCGADEAQPVNSQETGQVFFYLARFEK